MSATGLDVFDKTLQTTHIWLNEIMEATGPDKQVAWHVLGAVLRSIRNRVPLELAVHLGAELPLLVRGTYYDQWHLGEAPERYRSLDEFLRSVTENMGAIRPVNPKIAAKAVFDVLTRHVPAGQIGKIHKALPEEVRDLWRLDLFASETPPEEGVVTANPERAAHIRT